MKDQFSKLSKKAEEVVGHPATFSIAALAIGAWVVFGVFHGFTSYYLEVGMTTMETVAIVVLFVMQRAANVANESIQLKLNDLLRSSDGTERLDIEEKTDADRQAARAKDQREADAS